eukprot:CAMPEP_0201549036 /NCGR_PEP_ID=MMETSP0173_2-20130828/5516_1 /ASSEMBLY_ACC=CAM_ASM_000268 /TAXON_ID=218659 /ORGANISM="Vexillifera sp., Strain DIVA3 564/2" /LENGTH=183 /DNA_ID=CAMNT_0047958575 /DNA_START=19 /DNA_END=567 /DNA_ORIENTATION=-
MTERIYLAMVGPGGVGKSSLTIQFVQNHFVEEYDPTIEDSFRKQIQLDDGEAVLLDILDTAGQTKHDPDGYRAVQHCEGFLLVYDITSLKNFEALPTYVNQAVRVKDTEIHNVPLVIVANKCDLDEQRVISDEEGEQYAEKIGALHVQTSAKTGHNVALIFHALAKRTLVERTKQNQSSSSSK